MADKPVVIGSPPGDPCRAAPGNHAGQRGFGGGEVNGHGACTVGLIEPML
jgi:hypothetical protein